MVVLLMNSAFRIDQTWYLYLAVVLFCVWVPVYWFRRHVQQMKGRIGIVRKKEAALRGNAMTH